LDERYRIVSRIDSGGMAAVYRAEAVRLGRPVAVKVIHEHLAADPAFVERFQREARALARLNHPSVVQIFDQGTFDGRLYIAMEFVDGESMKDLLASRKPLEPAEALGLLDQATDGLAQAHKLGMVHRDIKPANILVAPDGRVKLADFGIARALGEAGLTRQGTTMGTVQYMAPELLRHGTVTPAVDIWALGITAYELLTGVQPFSGLLPAEVVAKQLADALPPPSGIVALPDGVDGLLAKFTAVDPARRIPDAAAALPPLRQLIAALAPANADRRATQALGTRVMTYRSTRLRAAGSAAADTGTATVPAQTEVIVRDTRVMPTQAQGVPLEKPVGTYLPPTRLVAKVPEPESPPATQVVPVGATLPQSLQDPIPVPARPKKPVLPALIAVLATLLVAGLGYLVVTRWPQSPEATGVPEQSASAPAETPSQTALATPTPELTTPEPTTTEPALDPAGDPEDVSDPRCEHCNPTIIWDGTELRLSGNAEAAWTAGKKLPTLVNASAGNIRLDFFDYPFDADTTITVEGARGSTLIIIPADLNVTIQWTNARNSLNLLHGLDGGKAWTNAEAKGSRKITVNDGPRLKLVLKDPQNSTTVDNKR
jgi:predicted Ser/Thr protein kinase